MKLLKETLISFYGFLKSGLFPLVFSIYLGGHYIKKFINGKKNKLDPYLVCNKIILLTGGGSGLGLNIAKLLLKNGATVIFLVRDRDNAERGIKKYIKPKYHTNILFFKCDLLSVESIRVFSEDFKRKIGTFDILIHNAGQIYDKYEKTNDLIEKNFACNHLGPFLLTMYLLKYINNKGRIIINCNLLNKYYEFNIAGLYGDVYFKHTNLEFVSNREFVLANHFLMAFGGFINIKHIQKLLFNKEFKSIAVNPGFFFNTNFLDRLKGIRMNITKFFYKPLIMLFGKNTNYAAQTFLHACSIAYDDLAPNSLYSDCDRERMNSCFLDENYCWELTYITYLRIRKFFTFERFPKEMNDFFHLMKFNE